ncbi:MAG TPA: AsmA family protein [Bacteroidales bacterium]
MKTIGYSRNPLKKLARIILFSLLTIIVLLSAGIGLLHYYKDDIAKKLVLDLNSMQQGEINISEVSINLTKHFPSLSLQLDSVVYFEKKQETQPILKIDVLYVAINLLDLAKGKFNVFKISLENADVDLVKLADGSFNLMNAIHPSKKDGSIKEADTAGFWNSPELSIKVKHLDLKNITISYHEIAEGIDASIFIKNIKARVGYEKEIIQLKLNSELEVLDYSPFKNYHFGNNLIEIQADLSYDMKSQLLTIQPSSLAWNKAIFDAKGTIELKDKGWIDLNLDGSTHQFSFLNLFLTEIGIKNIQEGELSVNGSIIGDLHAGIPNTSIHFKLKNLKVGIPGTDEFVEKANIEGNFSSGTKKDFSKAHVQIDTLSAELPGGNIAASMKMKDFINPEIDLLFELKARLNGLDKVFKINLVDSLGGKIAVRSRIKGVYDADSLETFLGTSDINVLFDSVSFSIPKVMYVNMLNGKMNTKSDTTRIDSLVFKTGDTDININGKIDNLLYLFLNKEKNIVADLRIDAPLYDLPQFLAYYPKAGKGFPYKIKDIHLDLDVSTTTTELLHSERTPEIEFIIKHLDATVIDFLAPVTISQGLFKLGSKDEGLLLQFENFKLQMEGADLSTDVEYFSIGLDSSFVNIDLVATKLNPAKVLYYQSKEKYPEMLDGIFNGAFSLLLNLSSDTSTFKNISLFDANFTYYLSHDTINMDSMDFRARSVQYNLEENANPLATLSATCELTAERFKASGYSFKNIELDLVSRKGDFRIDLKKINFFDENGVGHFEFAPFAESPTYKLNYSVNQFDIQPLTAHFMKDTLIGGKADFNINVTMHGNKWGNAVSNLDGEINFYGKNLTLYGYNVDNLVGKLKKSQNFNLIDLGAVLLAGPVGIAITKGSEYTSLLINRSDAVSKIDECISDWTIQNGILTAKDVAFTTEKNRIAAEGMLNLTSDSLNVTIAVLNKKGCSVMSQKLHGKIEHPKISTMKVAQSFIQPVINLVDVHAMFFCTPFYTGTLAQPERKEKHDE